jgi:hypothetical protein
MTVISPSLSAGLVALQAMVPVPAASSAAPAPPASAPALTGASRTVLSHAAADAVLGLNALTPREAAAAVSNASDTQARDGIPAAKVAWLESLDADAWALRKPAPLDDATFKQQALARLNGSGTSKLPGFAEARENGTLKIQRAAEMPDLGYRSYQLTLYREGTEFGGVGFNTINLDRWMELRRSGTFAVTGSISGNDYVATWPLPWDGDDAAESTPAQRAA